MINDVNDIVSQSDLNIKFKKWQETGWLFYGAVLYWFSIAFLINVHKTKFQLSIYLSIYLSISVCSYLTFYLSL